MDINVCIAQEKARWCESATCFMWCLSDGHWKVGHVWHLTQQWVDKPLRSGTPGSYSTSKGL